jgi:hypothetical protein
MENRPMTQLEPDSPFRSVIGLGDTQAIYTQSAASRFFNLAGCALVLLAAAGLFYYGWSYAGYYPDVAAENVPVIYGIGLLVLALGVYWGWWQVARWNFQAVLSANGFAFFNGRDVTSFKWNEITSIKMQVTHIRHYGIPAGTIRKYAIASSSTRLKMDGTLSRVDDLILNIRRNSLPFIVERQKQALNSGQFVPFGAVEISRDEGIRIGWRKLQWAEVQQLTVRNGSLSIVPRKRGLFSGAGMPVQRVENLDSLLNISDQLIRQSDPSAAR